MAPGPKRARAMHGADASGSTRLWMHKGTKVQIPLLLFVRLRNRQISLSCLLLSLSFHLSSPPKPSSPFDVRTSLLNVPCCDKAAQPLSLVHAEISLSSFQRRDGKESTAQNTEMRPRVRHVYYYPGRHQSTGWFNGIETENVKETTLQCGRNTLWVGSTAEIADDDDDSIGEAAEEVVEDCFGRRKVVTPSLPPSLLLALPEDRAGRGEQSAQAAVVTAPSERAPLLSSGAANCPAHILSRLAITGESRSEEGERPDLIQNFNVEDSLTHLSKLRTTATCPPRTLCMQSVRAHSKANRSNLPNAMRSVGVVGAGCRWNRST